MRQNSLVSPWWAVAASFSALFVGAGTMTYVLGVFLRPVTEGLGISRGVYSTGMLLFAMTAAVLCPLLGWALDRWGSRKVLLPLILGYAIVTAALSLLQPSAIIVFAMFALCGIVSLGLNAVPFARAISMRFDRQRGLALGIAISGAGFGIAVVPQVAGALIAGAGWRTAFVVYGAAIALIALLPVAIFIKEPVSTESAIPIAQRQATTGLQAAEAFRSWRFWAMVTAFFLAIIAVNGTVSHTTALLIDRGLSIQQATAAISIVGLAAIVGRIACGWMLDRFASSRIAILFFCLPIVGVGLIASGWGGPTPFVGAALLGATIGGEVDMMAYFTGGYFGMRAFGKIYGTMFAVFSAGTGIGPFISGTVYDSFHSYLPAFIAYALILVVACLLVSRLGDYPYSPRLGSRGGLRTEALQTS